MEIMITFFVPMGTDSRLILKRKWQGSRFEFYAAHDETFTQMVHSRLTSWNHIVIQRVFLQFVSFICNQKEKS
jgi:hypothetical protein